MEAITISDRYRCGVSTDALGAYASLADITAIPIPYLKSLAFGEKGQDGGRKDCSQTRMTPMAFHGLVMTNSGYKIYSFDFDPRPCLLLSSTSIHATSPNGLNEFPYSVAFALLACRSACRAAIPCMMILPR